MGPSSLLLPNLYTAVVDLTIPIRSNMAAMPDNELHARNPVILEALTVINEVQKGLLEAEGVDISKEIEVNGRSMVSKLTIHSHIGTHVDAPRHVFEKGDPIDEIPLGKIVKEGVLINLLDKGPDSSVSARDILETGAEFGPDVIPVIHTGWTEKMAGKPGFWEHIPYLKPDAVDLMVKKGVSAIALDMFVERAFWRIPLKPGEVRANNHLKLLGNGIVIIQFLTNLSQIGKDRFLLVALPLKLKGVDGGPARVIALVQ